MQAHTSSRPAWSQEEWEVGGRRRRAVAPAGFGASECPQSRSMHAQSRLPPTVLMGRHLPRGVPSPRRTGEETEQTQADHSAAVQHPD